MATQAEKTTYLTAYYPAAVKATAGTGLFPDTLVTQLIAESGYNLSGLARNHHNYHGLKADSAWKGKVVSMSTWESYNGQKVKFTGTDKAYASRAAAIAAGAHVETLFRKYDTTIDGFRGWVDFLRKNPRYAKAGVFTAKTPEEQFAALKRAGYATDPAYVQKLTAVYNGIKGILSQIPVAAGIGFGLIVLAAAVFF